MLAFLLSVALNCPEVIIVNETSIFNDFDNKTLEKAQAGCKRMYSKNHCLIRFYKMNELTYRAVCKDIEYITLEVE